LLESASDVPFSALTNGLLLACKPLTILHLRFFTQLSHAVAWWFSTTAVVDIGIVRLVDISHKRDEAADGTGGQETLSRIWI